MNTRLEQMAIDLRRQHRTTWRTRKQGFWLFGLLEEIAELILALAGLHKDGVDWELLQIAAICMNWMEMRAERTETAIARAEGIMRTMRGRQDDRKHTTSLSILRKE